MNSLTIYINMYSQCKYVLRSYGLFILQKSCLPDTSWFSKKAPVANTQTTPIYEKMIYLREHISITANHIFSIA